MHELAREVAQQVPNMRRFARAILGVQDQGDASVKRCLEALLKSDVPLAPGSARIALFKALNLALDQAEVGRWETPEARDDGPIGDGSILVRRIGSLEVTERRLLLLTILEGFTLGQAAEILDLEPGEAAAQLARAKVALRAQRSTRILIIEDEPVIALDLSTMVESKGHTVVGVARTHKEAVELARRSQPGLVLADIQLADRSSGLEAVQEILREMTVPVIFITAYPERLLTGERPEPTFLITKPFDPDTVAVSISQALQAAAQTATN